MLTAPQYAALAEACLARSDNTDSPQWALVQVGAAQAWAQLAVAAVNASWGSELEPAS
jgi:hypothetical protein